MVPRMIKIHIFLHTPFFKGLIFKLQVSGFHYPFAKWPGACWQQSLSAVNLERRLLGMPSVATYSLGIVFMENFVYLKMLP